MIKNIFNKIPIPIQVVLKLYLIGMGIFSFYRVLLLISNIEKTLESNLFLLAKSMFIGLRFDTTISGYALGLPLVLIIANHYLLKENKFVFKSIIGLTFILYLPAFFIAAIDIPYFHHFFDRISISIFLWSNDTNVSTAMFFEWGYLWPTLIFLGLNFYLALKLKNIIRFYNKAEQKKKWSHIVYTLLFITLFIFSLRGKIDFNVPPLDIRDAYHCEYSYLNKIALNPTFSLLRSYLDSKLPQNASIHFIDEDKALVNVKKYLNIKKSEFKNPIARQIQGVDSLRSKPNIVVVIMESMTAHKVGRYGNPLGLTPTLDDLATKGIVFDNFYSTGIHTFNGIFSTLYSYPAIYRQQPMMTSPINEYYGMPQVLKENGYQTSFFTTHNELFDNVGGFLRANAIDRVYSDKDYPKEKLIGTWGVADDYLFEYGIEEMNKMAKNNKPFLSVFMTCSDHAPYTLPSYFTPKNTEMTQQIVEYADWSISQLLEHSAKEPWFDNTIFVFVSDHGQAMNVVYEMPLSLNQIPCIIYAPSLLKPTVVSGFGVQSDIYPTLMGITNIPYVNTTMGVDLLKEKRKYAYFNGDDKFGVINDSLFYIYKDTEDEYLYHYKTKSVTNLKDSLPELKQEMKEYATSFLQTYQAILNKNLEGEKL